MKLKPKQITAAYRAVQELCKIVFPYKTARGVATLCKRLADENNTVILVEKNLVKEYGGTVSADGHCGFPDNEAAMKFQEARNVWLEQEDEIELPKVDLSQNTSLIRITPAAIEALDGIVIFD